MQFLTQRRILFICVNHRGDIFGEFFNFTVTVVMNTNVHNSLQPERLFDHCSDCFLFIRKESFRAYSAIFTKVSQHEYGVLISVSQKCLRDVQVCQMSFFDQQTQYMHELREPLEIDTCSASGGFDVYKNMHTHLLGDILYDLSRVTERTYQLVIYFHRNFVSY